MPARWFAVLLLFFTAPVAAEPQWQKIEFVGAFGETATAERATLIVPESRSPSPRGSISLPVVRFRSPSPDPGSPIIYLAGGPGNSGLDGAKSELLPTIRKLQSVADVVVFDQRGTGSAEPSLALQGTFGLPLERPLKAPESQARLVDIARTARAAMDARGVELSSYNTVESAEDIDALRSMLGAPKIVLWGHSYGSHLALQYIRVHPDRVAAAVLSGISDLPNRWRLPKDGDAFMGAVAEAIGRDGRLAERTGDFLANARQVLSDLEANPRTVQVNGRSVFVGADEVRTLIAASSGDIEFVQGLPLMFSEMAKGRFDGVAQRIALLKDAPIGTAMRYSMHLASGVDVDRAALIKQEIGGSLLGDAINFPYNLDAFREAWGARDLGSDFRAVRGADVPILFLNGELDGRTSLREARETASRFPNGTLTIVGGASHNFYTASPLISDAMVRFFRDGQRPGARLDLRQPHFFSPDELDQIAELKALLASHGVDAMIARMKSMAAATSGPYFNAETAKFLAFQLARKMQDPKAAVAVLEAADAIYPGDFSINRMLETFYKATGNLSAARARAEWLVRANPVAPGLQAELQSLR